MAINKVTLAKRINKNKIEYVYPRTSADMVEYLPGKSVYDRLQELSNTSINSGDAVIDSNTFIVTYVCDEESVNYNYNVFGIISCDKTVNEIINAYNSGATVKAKIINGENIAYINMQLAYSNSEDGYADIIYSAVVDYAMRTIEHWYSMDAESGNEYQEFYSTYKDIKFESDEEDNNQIQADYAQTNTEAVDYIKNKPNIGDLSLLLTNNKTSIVAAINEIYNMCTPSLFVKFNSDRFEEITKDNLYGATSIGDNAFNGHSSLKSIDIPDTVISIGNYAFNYCSSLYSVTIGNNVTSIGEYAFGFCSSLVSITIPSSVKEIKDYAFYVCYSLTSVNISNGVTNIGAGVFNGCSSLESINIPNSVTDIGEYAFSGCTSLTSITIPDSITAIGANAFKNCSSLTSIEIPDSVTNIGEYAFSGCSLLESVILSNNITSIEGNTFCDCTSLTSITIPNGVTIIGGYTFKNCSSLTSITIPNNVTSIRDNAFDYCNSLETVILLPTIPPTVVPGMYTNQYLFSFSNNVTSIIVPIGCGNTYKTASGWSRYADRIIEAEE